MPYALKYFRDPKVVVAYREHGINSKPVGYVISKACTYEKWEQAQKVADHINALGPSIPVEVVEVSRSA